MAASSRSLGLGQFLGCVLVLSLSLYYTTPVSAFFLPCTDYYDVALNGSQICPPDSIFYGGVRCNETDPGTCTNSSLDCFEVFCEQIGVSDHCGDPRWQIDNSDVVMSDCIGASVGDTCPVVCEPDHYPDPVRLAVTCIGTTGLWSESSCTRNTSLCSHPGDLISNLDDVAMSACDGAAVGDTCNLVCETGFVPSPAVITCESYPFLGITKWSNAICNATNPIDYSGCYYFQPPTNDFDSCDQSQCCCLGNPGPQVLGALAPLQVEYGSAGIDPTGSVWFYIRNYAGKCLYENDPNSNFVFGPVEIDAFGTATYFHSIHGIMQMHFGLEPDGITVNVRADWARDEFICPHNPLDLTDGTSGFIPLQKAVKGECPTRIPTDTPNVVNPDISILNKVYNGTHGDEWLERPASHDQWPFSETQWCDDFVRTGLISIQITCDPTIDPNNITRVTGVKITNNKVRGPMDRLNGYDAALLSQLDYLTHLDLSGNLLEGIPPWSRLFTSSDFDSLQVLRLRINPLSTTIPTSLYSLHNLQVLDLSVAGLYGDGDSMGFKLLFSMPFLRILYLQKNFFTGPVFATPMPGFLPFGRNLEHIFLGRNFLGGAGAPLPSDLFTATNFPALTNLGLNDNRFVGFVPSSIQTLSDIAPGTGSATQVNIAYNDLNCPLDANYATWFTSEDSWYYNNLVCCPNFDSGVNYECCCGTTLTADIASLSAALATAVGDIQALSPANLAHPYIQSLLLKLYDMTYYAVTAGTGIPRFRVSNYYSEAQRYNISYGPPGGYGHRLNGAAHPKSFYA